MTSRLALALTLIAAPAFAETVAGPVSSDLDGDGHAETFRITHDNNDGRADLVIENANGTIKAADIAWIGGIGQRPELDVAPNGSVRVVSMNASIGRNRWYLTLTIAHRDGAYRVAGYTYSWYDTLNPDDNGLCDLNLLTGKGILDKGENGPKRAVRTNVQPLPVTEWKDDHPIPDVCEVY